MQFKDYYLQELSALRQDGKHFAQQHPRLAPFLAEEGQDPDVERILEGLAFLSARLQRRLDGDWSELSQSLLSVFWPQQTTVLPSASIVEFTPRRMLRNNQVIAAGTCVDSRMVEGTRCRFRTTRQVNILPMKLTRTIQRNLAGSSQFQLTFELFNSDFLRQGEFDSLDLFFHGDKTIAQYWLYQLARNTEYWQLSVDGCAQTIRGDQSSIQPSGWSDAEALLPSSGQLPSGLRTAQEYLWYPEKFQYLVLSGIAKQLRKLPESSLVGARRLSIEFHTSQPAPDYLRPPEDVVRLHCSPVVNLFESETVPLQINHRQGEYRLRAEGQPAEHFDIYTINSLKGWCKQRRQYRYYQAVVEGPAQNGSVVGQSERESISNGEDAGLSTESDSVGGYYWLRRSPSISRHTLWETSVRLLDTDHRPMWPEEEILSSTILATNAKLPQALAIGDISKPTETTPEFVDFSNITPVTPAFYPPTAKGGNLELLDLMRAHFADLADSGQIKRVLLLLDRRGHFEERFAQSNAQKRNALLNIRAEAAQRLERGRLVIGRKVECRVSEEGFSGEGDLFLFGEMLYRLFQSYRPVNSFLQFEMLSRHSGRRMSW